MFLYYDTTELDYFFEDAFSARSSALVRSLLRQRPNITATSIIQRLDLHESTETNTMTAAIEFPGLTSDGVAIDVHQNHLTVSGESVTSDSEEQSNYVVHGHRVAEILPDAAASLWAKSEDIKANGILTTTFPETSPEQEARRIVIQ